MGERCQPLDISGSIYYDAEGHRRPRLALALRSPLLVSAIYFLNPN